MPTDSDCGALNNSPTYPGIREEVRQGVRHPC